jgi:hypothetical protein
VAAAEAAEAGAGKHSRLTFLAFPLNRQTNRPGQEA